MKIRIFDDRIVMAKAAAERAIEVIQQGLAERGQARIVASAGESQVDLLRELTAHRYLDWASVEVFCIGEYLDLPQDHPASFRRFIQDRLIAKAGIRHFNHFGTVTDGNTAMAVAGARLQSAPVDLALVGIGDSGQLALNSPPADLETEEPFLMVDLDFGYRTQQVNEGWFADVGQVPMKAISMSARQILKAKEILAVVPGTEKALAVKVCVEHGVSPTAPATILKTHANTTIYLDRESSAQLSPAGGGEPSGRVYTNV